MTPKARISKAGLESYSHAAWNAFVDLMLQAPYEELSDTQRIAYHAYWYDSEVQNGGHLQFFKNRDVTHLAEILAALKILGATGQHGVLARAGDRWKSDIASTELDDLDGEYYRCEPEIPELLEAYLHENLSAFIVWENNG